MDNRSILQQLSLLDSNIITDSPQIQNLRSEIQVVKSNLQTEIKNVKS